MITTLHKKGYGQMITVLHRGGYAQMITILHGGGSLGTPKSDYVICARPLIGYELKDKLLNVVAPSWSVDVSKKSISAEGINPVS